MSDSLTSLYKPKHQLVIYTSETKNSFVEHYEIIDVEGKQVLSEGKPLTKKVLKQLMESVMTTGRTMFATIHKLLPENVIYYDPRPGRLRMIWFNKPQQRSLHGIYKKEVKAKIPAVIYYLEDDSLNMYVFKSNKRPDLKTPLFHAPMPNIYEDGRVCMGNVKKPQNKSEIADLVQAWETAFWTSEFSDSLWSNEQQTNLKRSIRLRTQYPAKLLKPHKSCKCTSPFL